MEERAAGRSESPPHYPPLRRSALAWSSARISRSHARVAFRTATLSPVHIPCLKLPLRSPVGPPEPLAPPCIRVKPERRPATEQRNVVADALLYRVLERRGHRPHHAEPRAAAPTGDAAELRAVAQNLGAPFKQHLPAPIARFSRTPLRAQRIVDHWCGAAEKFVK